ncbi:MAG TPA: hypothetical protein VHP30_09185, partial [Ignavibacteriales bacterium]|nr:hypothetical protein [Ignavibacteriales bacterium]
MKMLIKAMVVFLTMLLVGSCDNSTENKGDNEPDSTTQNFTFEEYEFGDGSSSSYFNDVWIFDENNIWVVGEVLDDPRFDKTYNIFQWNGSKWLGRGRLFNSGGIDGIWALDSSHIYFAVGGVIEYKNQTFTILETNLGLESNQGIEHLWGSSESNIWGVGPWGTIVHYDGSKWTKLEMDAQNQFRGVTGDKQTGTAYALAYTEANPTIIYELQNGAARAIFTSTDIFAWDIEAGGGNLYFSETEIWRYNINEKKAEKIYQPRYGSSALRIAYYSDKDIYFFGSLLGSQEQMIHYNGKRFRDFDMGYYLNSYGGAYAVKDLCVRVLFSNNKAHLVKIRRIP